MTEPDNTAYVAKRAVADLGRWVQGMMMEKLANSNSRPAPCGIVCATCIHLSKGCAGCNQGGGAKDCYIRECTERKRIRGCWLCDEFPCEHIRNLDPAWRGLNTGFIELIKEIGEEEFSACALKNIGHHAEYGNLRFTTIEEAKELINKGTQPAR